MLARIVRAGCAAGLFLTTVLSASSAPRPFTLTVQRNMTCEDGSTMGRLLVDGKEIARTLELPWRNDEENISRVQADTYRATIRQDGDHLGWRIELLNVPKHTHVELHVGNTADNTNGCILVGTTLGTKQCSVDNSKAALTRIQQAMQAASSNGVSSQPIDITVEVRDH